MSGQTQARLAGRTVRASEDDPQYEVRSEKSGGTAVHKPGALHNEPKADKAEGEAAA